ncbi:MAG: ribbon-helix-helix protein, CopG family [Candidatus Dormibacteraeota bacterium]|nr:ribbon-helix-helix protein, CopG family [Candidatus Dormibacteraeota bacterium]
MRKTSVYLSEEEAEGLYRAAAASGKSQAQLLREGVQKVIAEWETQPRTFRSMAIGRGGRRDEPYASWDAGDLYRKEMGDRR